MTITRSALILIGFAVAITALPWTPAHAQGQLSGVRAMGMGDAFTAAATGAGALFHNPAGMSAIMMYSVEASYLYDQETGLSSIHASIVDGKSNQSLGGGVGYVYSVSSSEANIPGYSGHDVYGALSMPVVPGWLIVGVAMHYLDYSQFDQGIADGFTLDSGLMISLGDFVSLGAAVRNILEVENAGRPLQAGFGLNFHTHFLQVAVDTVMSFECSDSPCMDYRFGVEYVAVQLLPLRIGYQYEPSRNRQYFSAGAGWRHQLLGLDILFRQDLDEGDNRLLGLAVNVYL